MPLVDPVAGGFDLTIELVRYSKDAVTRFLDDSQTNWLVSAMNSRAAHHPGDSRHRPGMPLCDSLAGSPVSGLTKRPPQGQHSPVARFHKSLAY